MKPESRFWRWLEKRLPKGGHYSRVEPPPSPGIPDVNYCIDQIEGWMELKVRAMAARPFKKRGKRYSEGLLRPTQRRWFKSRIRAHGRVLTCVRIGAYVHLISASKSLLVSRDTTYEEFCEMCYYIQRMSTIGVNDGILRTALCQVPE